MPRAAKKQTKEIVVPLLLVQETPEAVRTQRLKLMSITKVYTPPFYQGNYPSWGSTSSRFC